MTAGKDRRDPSPTPGSGTDAQLATGQADPLAHPDQAEALASPGRLETLAVVLDDHRDLAPILAERDPDRVRVGVLDHVVERLLDDSVHRRLELGGVPVRLAAGLVGEIEVGLDLAAPRARGD